MTFKQRVARTLFGVEVLVVVGFYFFGSNGTMALMHLKNELAERQQVVALLQADIRSLNVEHDSWARDPFFIEKHAREKLAMARDGEKIYVIV